MLFLENKTLTSLGMEGVALLFFCFEFLLLVGVVVVGLIVSTASEHCSNLRMVVVSKPIV